MKQIRSIDIYPTFGLFIQFPLDCQFLSITIGPKLHLFVIQMTNHIHII